jgi:DNA-binding NarL/FixJ family response regulator
MRRPTTTTAIELPPVTDPAPRVRLRIGVQGGDALTRAGLRSLLGELHDLEAAPADGRPDIGLVVLDAVTPQGIAALHQLSAVAGVRVVVLLGEVSTEAVALAVQAGEAVIPTDLLAALMPRQGAAGTTSTAPRLLAMATLTDRERDVLRMLGDGSDTREIARAMSYSERTVKTVIQDITRRFGLRNRSHAVAYAVRQGLI